MARLSIEQIRAPYLSVASQATARAGKSFQEGMTSASDLLSNYQAGIEESGDAEIFQEIAQLGTEEEYNAFINGPALAGRPMSKSMRERIMAGRGAVLGFEQNRADRRGTDARTGLTFAQTGLTDANTGRVQNSTRIATNEDNRAGRTSDYNYGAIQDGNQVGALAAAAQAEGLRNGNVSGLADENVSGLTGPSAGGGSSAEGDVLTLARTLQAEAGSQGYESMLDVGSVIRNRSVSGRYGDGINGVIMKPGQFSAWNGVTGYAGGEQGQNMEFQPNEEAMRAAEAILSGNYQDNTGGATHYYNPDAGSGTPSWGNESFKRRGAHVFGNADAGQGPVDENPGRAPVTQNPNAQQGPAAQALQAALANPELRLTPDQRLALGQGNYNTAITGQNAINAADQEAAAEQAARQRLDIADDPNNITPTDAIVAGNNVQPGATAVETEAARAAILAGVKPDGALLAAMTAGTDTDPEKRALAQTIIEERAAEVERSPILRAAAGAISFSNDPKGSLVAAMQGLDISTTPSDIEAAINKLAREAEITPAEAAYTFARAAEDPKWFDGWDNLSQRRARELADQWFKGDGAREARQTLRDNESLDRDVMRLQDSVQAARQRMQKSANNNDGTPAASYVRAYETAAGRLDDAVQESVGGEDVPDDQITIPTNPGAVLPYLGNGAPTDGSDIEEYLSSLRQG